MPTVTELVAIVSAELYARLLTSQRLGRLLLPEGLRGSPYEVLSYDATLILEDAKGVEATLATTRP